MPRAVRPLFAAAALMLLVSVVVLGVRSSDDGDAPTALPTASETGGLTPTSTSTPSETASPSETETEMQTETETEVATETETATEGTGTGGTEGTGTGGTEGTGTGGTETEGTGTGGTETEGTGTGGTETEGEGREVDDMPNTGGGAATALGGLVALGAAAGIARRRS